MAKFKTGSINLSKIDQKYLFVGKTGDKYCNVVLWENDTPDQYGNDGAIQQSFPQEVRESGVKAPYLGNFKNPKAAAKSNNDSADDLF